MYQKQDAEQARREARKWTLIAFACGLPFIALMVVLAVTCHRWLAIAAGVIGTGSIVFIDGTKAGYLRAYRTYLDSVASGLTHEHEMVLREDRGVVFFEKMLVHRLIVDEDGKEATVYFDAQKQMPDWKAGDEMHVTLSGRHIVDFKQA